MREPAGKLDVQALQAKGGQGGSVVYAVPPWVHWALAALVTLAIVFGVSLFQLEADQDVIEVRIRKLERMAQ